MHLLTMSTACPLFAPNKFNHSLCQNCLRARGYHKQDAKEIRHLKRKILRCGYLFVSPYQFSTGQRQKWLRRWFILYDDGELTYSLDEDPETVPQNILNLRQVQEVIQEVPGEENACVFALKRTEQVLFIKGTNAKEKKR